MAEEYVADVGGGSTGTYYPQDFDLEAIDIITSSGDTVKLKFLMTELSLFEDIYSFVVSGYVILADAVGLLEKLQLDGNEYLRIVYGKSKNNSNLTTDHYYRIYKVGNRRPVGNYTSEFFTLHFCSEELLLSTQQTQISKSYKEGRQIGRAHV